MTSACLTIIERLDEIELIGRVQTTDTDRAISTTAFQNVWGCLMCRDGKSRLVALQTRHRGGGGANTSRWSGLRYRRSNHIACRRSVRDAAIVWN